jgi:hypothetical protein
MVATGAAGSGCYADDLAVLIDGTEQGSGALQ